MIRHSDKSLVKRYLFWLYKMTRDELDRIDRKFTQLEVDRGIQKIFREHEDGVLAPFIGEWDKGGVLSSYVFLRLKLEAVQSVASKRFGRRIVSEFEKIYEDAAMKNILQDTSGRR
jgi:hypothetical protein